MDHDGQLLHELSLCGSILERTNTWHVQEASSCTAKVIVTHKTTPLKPSDDKSTADLSTQKSQLAGLVQSDAAGAQSLAGAGGPRLPPLFSRRPHVAVSSNSIHPGHNQVICRSAMPNQNSRRMLTSKEGQGDVFHVTPQLISISNSVI